MRSLLRAVPIFCVLLLNIAELSAQSIDTVLFEEVGRYQHPYVPFPDHFSATTYSSKIDRLGRPYLYMACKDTGLMVLDISDPSTPIVVHRHPPSEFEDLDVMNVEQVDDLLYVCLGNFQGGGQSAGLAILDVSDPATPVVLDVWNGGTTYVQGSAIVRITGDRAYLGAMEDGLIVLDVDDPSQIGFVSAYQPDPTWPGIASYAPNARGMAIADDLLLLAYDAGGLRAIDISTPSAPSEIGRYLNPDIPILTNPAYNNVVVIGERAYCTIDYCGIEVVDISDPANMAQVAWLNPWNCIGFSWFGSDGHTNEIVSSMGDSLLFVSGGDSEILAYDITNADLPVLKGGWILPNDTAATWGVDVHGDLAVGNFINNHGLPAQPYDSKYGGVVIFEWTPEFSTQVPQPACFGPAAIGVWPNPSTGVFNAGGSTDRTAQGVLRVTDVLGHIVVERRVLALTEGWKETLNLSEEGPGLYLVSIQTPNEYHRTIAVLRKE